MEVVKAVYDLFASRDMDAAFDRYLEPGFEVITPPIYPEGEQTFRGRKGILSWTRMIAEVWGEWRFELGSVEPAEETVLALVRIVAEGGASGVRLEREVAHVWEVANGRASRVRVYLDRAEGVAAAR